MRRRERLERKLERRREWAEKAEQRSGAHLEQGHKMFDAIPFGQPILVGHHSEKRDRNYRARAGGHIDKGLELAHLAEHHESKADGLEHQLDKAIFSDDTDATEALKERIAANEAKREQMKKVNAMYRKGDVEGLRSVGLDLEKLREKLKTAYSWCQQPYPAYELQNLGQRISGDKKRLEFIKKQNETRAQAEAAPNGVILKQYGEWCSVTFAEKPDRSILDALCGAGFRWGSGSWSGKVESLPAEVKALLQEV